VVSLVNRIKLTIFFVLEEDFWLSWSDRHARVVQAKTSVILGRVLIHVSFEICQVPDPSQGTTGFTVHFVMS
jgi:hypothetical protein